MLTSGMGMRRERRRDPPRTYCPPTGRAGQVPACQGSQPVPAESLKNKLCCDSSTTGSHCTFHVATYSANWISLQDVSPKASETKIQAEAHLGRVWASPVAQPSNAGDAGSFPGSGRSPGGRSGNPLQCSCLENPTDRGAWWATPWGSQSQT